MQVAIPRSEPVTKDMKQEEVDLVGSMRIRSQGISRVRVSENSKQDPNPTLFRPLADVGLEYTLSRHSQKNSRSMERCGFRQLSAYAYIRPTVWQKNGWAAGACAKTASLPV